MEYTKKLFVLSPEQLAASSAPSKYSRYDPQHSFLEKLGQIELDFDKILNDPLIPDDVKTKFLNQFQLKFQTFQNQYRSAAPSPAPFAPSKTEPLAPPAKNAPSETEKGPKAPAKNAPSKTEKAPTPTRRDDKMSLLERYADKKHYKTVSEEMKKLDEMPGITWDYKTGEVRLRGKVLPDSNIVELIQFDNTARTRNRNKPKGWTSFRKFLDRVEPQMGKGRWLSYKELCKNRK